MEMTLSLLAVVVSVLALFVALITHGEANKQREREHPPRKAPRVLTNEERRAQAVQRREHDNFMTYDGTEQIPIDPDTILAESGKHPASHNP